MDTNDTVGVIVGRFQTPYLHGGHWSLITHVLRLHPDVLIIIGDRNAPPTTRNPLSYEVRRKMIEEEVRPFAIDVVKDTQSNELWSRWLDEAIERNVGERPAILYCGRDNFKDCYSGDYPVVECEFGIDDISATEIRETYRTGIINTHAFRAGIIHAHYNAWHRTYETVDMALFRNRNTRFELCLIRKPGLTTWQLPGGFVDAKEKFSDAAAREMMEETGLASPDWVIISDYVLEDWRVRGIEGVSHRTVLMAGTSTDGSDPTPGDDAEEAKFFPLNNIHMEDISPNHREMIQRLKSDYGFLDEFTG